MEGAINSLKNKMKVKIKKVDHNAIIPIKAHAADAGFDLYCTNTAVDYKKQQLICRTGLAFEIPEGYAGLLFPCRSVSSKPLMMDHSVGVINSGCRGEVTVRFFITNMMEFYTNDYQAGDRIAQLIIIPYPEIEFEETDSLSESDRGTGGYGSTGR